MSLGRPRDHQQLGAEVSSSSTPTRHHYNVNALLDSSVSPNKRKVEESDEDLFMVPDVESRPVGTDDKIIPSSNGVNPELQNGLAGKRRRGRNPVDKEYRRLKRLLRNRVSAQLARERKKVYVNDLESRVKELQDGNEKLEEKISTLINENSMLRKVLLNSRPKVADHVEPKQDQLGSEPQLKVNI